MKQIVIPEYGQIVRYHNGHPPHVKSDQIAYLDDRTYRRLERYEHRLNRDGQPIFTFYRDYAQARQWVGLVQIPGLQIEILPKVDSQSTETGSANVGQWCQVRQNLLYMLSVSGDVPVRTRDMTRLATRRAPLNETLGALFASTLLEELLRGSDRNYVTVEENLRSFRGRLLIGRHLQKNAAHRERFYCRYDQFSGDTALNRIFKAAVRLLLGVTQTPATQDTLRHCLLILDDVCDISVTTAHFDRITFNRQNERFSNLFHFCRLIIGEQAPTIQSGGAWSFSLLFDMNAVFERFIAAFLQNQVMPNLPECRLHPQARSNRRPLFLSDNNQGVMHLTPDILVRHRTESRNLVIDTKWKRISSGSREAPGNVSNTDLYQLYAYTRRFGCTWSILLYPLVSGALKKDFYILDEMDCQNGQQVSIRFVNLNRNLYAVDEKKALADELEQLVREGMGLVPGGKI